MRNRTCSVPECTTKHYSLGYCQKHFARLKRTGTVDEPKRETLEERFWKSVDKAGTCWLWTGYKNRSGYGMISDRPMPQYVHRLSYELANGPIPEGKRIDHVCHVPLCVNPDHLRPVTIKQNAENYSGLPAHNTSGVRGVYWHAGGKKWSVQVTHNGQRYSGGLHADIKDAEAAAIALRNKLHTHNDLDRLAS